MSDRSRKYRRALNEPLRYDVALYAGLYLEELEAEVEELRMVRRALVLDNRDKTNHVRELQARVRGLEAAVAAVRNLINNSEGVAGLHLNGDVAPWDELMEGGDYEVWLGALAAVSAEKGVDSG